MKKAKGLFSSPSLTVRCAFDMCSSAVVPPKPCDADVLRNKVHSLRWESGGKARVRFFFFSLMTRATNHVHVSVQAL